MECPSLTPHQESREPRAESREPRAESREPRAESREPRAEPKSRDAESREPRAESREPRAESYGAAMSAPRASRGASSQSDSQPSAAPAGARLSDTPHPQGLLAVLSAVLRPIFAASRNPPLPHRGRKRAVFVFAALLLLTGGNARAQGTVATDRAALVALYNATGGANWTNNTNWTSNEALSEWHGVTTDANGRVTDLYLTQNGLSGEIPAELGDLTSLLNLYLWLNNLSGEIPAELGGLTSLQYLFLGDNNLSGEIPAELGGLTSLQNLYLAQNGLSGEIPAELGDLTSLLTLDLQNNNLSGEIPAELGGLTSLQNLFLRDNNLSGEIPAELGGLTSLLNLYLRNNNLSGEIPAELGDLTSLLVLDLQNNNLSGEIPAELGGLTNLQNLYLAKNELSGEIPAELGGLTSLRYLYLWGTELSGEIPAELGDLTSLLVLDLWQNNLSGEIPAELGGLTSLWSLFLGGNKLSGEIPAELGDLTNLFDLDLQNNNLSGEIPAELGDLANLEILYLDQNELSGEIPAELGDLTSLQRLFLHSNELSGPIPSWLVNLTGLLELSLWSNQLTGMIPAEVAPAQDRAAARVFYNSTGGANWTDNTNWRSNEPLSEWHGVSTDGQGRIEELRLSANGLTGTIGAELGVLTHLTGLYLNDNELTGPIPPELENLAQLQVFDVRNTGLSCVMAGSELHTWLTTINFQGTVCATQPPGGEWSAILTPGASGSFVGCDNDSPTSLGACSDPRVLTSDQFIHAGKTYSITWLVYDPTADYLEIYFVPGLTGTAKHYLTLVVDGTPLAFGAADDKSDSAAISLRSWTNPGFSWSAGQSVSLRLEPEPWLPEGELGATSVFAKRYRAGNVKVTWNNITIDGAPLPDQPDGYAVTVSGGRRNTTWALSHLETGFGDPLGRGNRYTVQHPTSTSTTANPNHNDVAFTYTLKVIGDEWLASGKTFLRIDCPPIGSANVVDCGLSTAPSALRPFNASAYESYGPMPFRVEVDPPSSGTVTVDYATANRTSGSRRALAGQDYYATSGTLTFAPGETAKFVVVGIIDDAVRDGGETFYLNFSNATGATLSDGQVTGTINNTEPFVNPPSDPPDPSDPLTASFSGVPGEHTGESFTFGLTFSENVAGLSYKTLRDSAFSVRNGQITRARRKQKGSNQSWTITVKPDSSAAVTIRLPATTDCEADDAICTSDARRLSNSPSATIPGAAALDFAHFAKGATIISEMVLVNAAPHPSRPAIYFYDTKGDPIPADSVVDLTGDLEVTEDGALTVWTEMESLEALTISTHGRGELVSGSVKVLSEGPIRRGCTL